MEYNNESLHNARLREERSPASVTQSGWDEVYLAKGGFIPPKG
jgi:hypothetical protein